METSLTQEKQNQKQNFSVQVDICVWWDMMGGWHLKVSDRLISLHKFVAQVGGVLGIHLLTSLVTSHLWGVPLSHPCILRITDASTMNKYSVLLRWGALVF